MTRPRRTHGTSEDGALIESFLDMMSAERGASANTLVAYRRDLLDFAAGCARRSRSLKSASREDVRKHLALLSAAALKPSSQARKLSALRRFYAFLYGEGVRRDDPCGAVEGPQLSRPLPKILTAEETLRLVETARLLDAKTPAKRADAARLHCIVEMLYASGMRVSELVALPFASVRVGTVPTS